MSKPMNKELLQCAEANFENFEKVFPIALKHPFYIIAKAQFIEGMGGPPIEETIQDLQEKQ